MSDANAPPSSPNASAADAAPRRRPLTESCHRVVNALRPDRELTPYQIMDETDRSKLTVYRSLRRLRVIGVVECVVPDSPRRAGRPSNLWRLRRK